MAWVVALTLLAAAVALALFLARRRVRPPTPALRLAGGPADDAAEDAAAGRPLFDAIAAALRARGADVAAIERDDWGYSADAVVVGTALRLCLAAHGANGVGPEWLLVLDGAADDPALRSAIEDALGGVAGLRILGWDD